MNESKMIKAWAFEDAPDEYRKLSDNGGDEDWIALVPPLVKDYWIPWLESGSSFGVCCVHKHELEEGTIYIGCHS